MSWCLNHVASQSIYLTWTVTVKDIGTCSKRVERGVSPRAPFVRAETTSTLVTLLEQRGVRAVEVVCPTNMLCGRRRTWA